MSTIKRSEALNEALEVELSDLIETSGADYWIYGHHHQVIKTSRSEIQPCSRTNWDMYSMASTLGSRET